MKLDAVIVAVFVMFSAVCWLLLLISPMAFVVTMGVMQVIGVAFAFLFQRIERHRSRPVPSQIPMMIVINQ